MANKQRILLIEDDQYIRDVYTDILTEAGFEVDTAVNGEEGLVKISGNTYSLILLDMMMPKVDGLGVLTSIKANPPKQPNGPIVLLTNLAHDPVIKQAMELGAKNYIIKSDVNPDQLVAKIKEALSQSAAS